MTWTPESAAAAPAPADDLETDAPATHDLHDVAPADAADGPSGAAADAEVHDVAPADAADGPDGAHAAPARAPTPVPATPSVEELELAAAALHEVTPRGSVGDVLEALLEGGHGDQAQVLAIRHASALPGYPDWTWTVLLSRGIEGGPTVLEVALLPGDSSLLAPAWVPWSERLADYLAAKEAAGEDDEELDPELESDLESDLEDDFDDDFVDEDEDEDEDEDDQADGWGEVAESDSGPDDARG